MSPAGWLLLAAILLIIAAGWCAGAQTALARTDLDGLDRYGSLLTLIRVCAEVSAAVLVTLAFAHWLGGGWQVFPNGGNGRAVRFATAPGVPGGTMCKPPGDYRARYGPAIAARSRPPRE